MKKAIAVPAIILLLAAGVSAGQWHTAPDFSYGDHGFFYVAGSFEFRISHEGELGLVNFTDNWFRVQKLYSTGWRRFFESPSGQCLYSGRKYYSPGTYRIVVPDVTRLQAFAFNFVPR